MSNERRPNIVWISFEDCNPAYGCYGDPAAVTPANLDRLASEGSLWTRCFSTAGVCAPARSAVITGMYPTAIGTHHMRTAHTNEAAPGLPTPYSAVVPHYVKCFTEYLRAAGYYCTNNAKTDYQFAPPRTAWDELSSDAHWRHRSDPDQPFFAVFNPMRTHESGMWDDRDLAGSTEEASDLVDTAAIRVPPYFPDTQRVRNSLARMYRNIAESDRELGELLAQLREDGLEENTIVMHWSDHGPLPRGKRWPYDSGIRVPLIVKWPRDAGNPGAVSANEAPRGTEPLRGFDPGTVCDNLVSTVDLGPTVLSLAGVPIPAHIQGRVFLGASAKQPRDYVFASRDRYDESYDMIRAARDRRFKYIRHFAVDQPYLLWIPYRNRHPIMQELWRAFLADELTEDQSVMFRPRPAEELYDTESDPFELRNLAAEADHADTLARLRAALDGWRASVGDLGEMSESDMVRGWYPDGRQPTTEQPLFVPLSAESMGGESVPGHARRAGFAAKSGDSAAGGEHALTAPAALQLYCATQGASIAFALGDAPPERWALYTGPIRLPEGTTTVRARAIRIGYHESEESIASFVVAEK